MLLCEFDFGLDSVIGFVGGEWLGDGPLHGDQVGHVLLAPLIGTGHLLLPQSVHTPHDLLTLFGEGRRQVELGVEVLLLAGVVYAVEEGLYGQCDLLYLAVRRELQVHLVVVEAHRLVCVRGIGTGSQLTRGVRLARHCEVGRVCHQQWL